MKLSNSAFVVTAAVVVVAQYGRGQFIFIGITGTYINKEAGSGGNSASLFNV